MLGSLLTSCKKATGINAFVVEGNPIFTTDMTEKEIAKNIEAYLLYEVRDDTDVGRRLKNFSIEVVDGMAEGYRSVSVKYKDHSCNLSIFFFEKDKLVYDGDFVFYNFNSKDYLVRYTGSATAVTLPERGEYSIFSTAFLNCDSIYSVRLGNSVTEICEEGFAGCISLREITFGSSVESVCSRAFVGCNITRVNALSIESWCNINFGVMSDLEKGRSNWVGDEIYIIDTANTNLVFSSDSNTVHYETAGSNVTNLVTNTDKYEITIDAAVGTVAQIATTNLTADAIYENLFLSGNISNPLCTAKALYVNGERVTNLVIPESVTSISYFAFCGADITSLTVHRGVKEIGWGAFLDCDQLTDVQIHSTEMDVINNIKGAIPSTCWNDYNNAKYLGNSANPYMILVNAGNPEGAFELHSDTVAIAQGAFAEAKNTTEVTVHDGVERIAAEAFKGLSENTTVYIGAGVREMGAIRLSLYVNQNPTVSFVFANQYGWYYINDSGVKINIIPGEVSREDAACKYTWYHDVPDHPAEN